MKPLHRLLHIYDSHIGARVLAGFGIITLLALLVALISLANVAAVHQRLNESVARDREATANILRLELSIEQQSDAVRGYLLSGDERDLQGFLEAEQSFDDTIATLDSQFSAEQARSLLLNIRYSEGRFRDVARQQITLYQQGWPISAIYLWSVSGRERQDDLLADVQALAAWHEATVGQELANAQASSVVATVLALGLVVLSAVVSSVLSVVLTRSVTRPIRILAGIAQTIKSGDLRVSVPPMGQDEIGTLARTIDQMASSLRESHASLEASLLETEQRNRELMALNTVASAAATLDLTSLLDRTLETVLDLTGAEYGGIHLRNANGALQPVAQRGFSPEFLTTATLDTLTSFLASVLDGAPATIDDATTEPAPVIALVRQQGISAAVAVPLTSQSTTVGVLSVCSAKRAAFEPSAVALLTSIGNQVGVAVENASLLYQREQRITTLSVINEVSRAISAVLELEELYTVIYDQCRRSLDIPDFFIAEVDEQTGGLTPCLLYLDHERQDPQRGWPYSADLSTDDANLRPLPTTDFIATCGAQPWDPTSTSVAVASSQRYSMTVPLAIGERLVGLIAVASPTPYAVEDRDLLIAVANQAAVAIDNAHLYQRTREIGVIEERNRLAREIHDTIAQGLTGIVLQLEAVATLLDVKPERAQQRLTKATELARATLTEARRSVWNLRPAPLEQRTLAAALSSEIRRLQEDNIAAVMEVEGDVDALTPEIENGLYRITQEALQNVRKHAGATAVEVRLIQLPGTLRLVISDNGRGVDVDRLQQRRGDGSGFGLLSMRERARLIGGALTFASSPGEGTRLEVTVPLSTDVSLPPPTQPSTPTAPRARFP